MTRSTLSRQNVKNSHSRAIFVSSDVEKWHAVVAPSTFTIQNDKADGGRGTLLKMYQTHEFRTSFRRDVAKLSDRRIRKTVSPSVSY